jgi:hypothetical protein
MPVPRWQLELLLKLPVYGWHWGLSSLLLCSQVIASSRGGGWWKWRSVVRYGRPVWREGNGALWRPGRWGERGDTDPDDNGIAL